MTELPNSFLEPDQLLMQDSSLCSKVDTGKYMKKERGKKTADCKCQKPLQLEIGYDYKK